MKKASATKAESKPAAPATKPAKVVAAKTKVAETKPKIAAPKAKAEAAPKVVKKPAAKQPPRAPATVVVRYDAGWGNALHLRGEGPGLSWDTGTPMCCVNGTEWVWVAPAVGTISFKVLHNDNAWSLGENIVAAPGETVTVTPVF